VLREVDLEVADGSFVTLVGPSGCGKSTMLNLVAGFERPSSGDVLIDGEVVNDRSPRARGAAMVFQGYALYPHLDVRRNIAFPLRARGPGAPLDARARAGGGRPPRDRAPPRSAAEGALRRPAPAGGAGPGAGAEDQALPLRRAALQPRRRDPLPHAPRDQEAP